MKYFKLTLLSLTAMAVAFMSGCNNDDDGPAALALISLTANGTSLADGSAVSVDLNGVTSATDVPPDAVITAEFSEEIDPATADMTSITLSTADADVEYTVAVNGSTVVLTPASNLIQGTLHTLSISSELQSASGVSLTAATRTFTTSGTAPAEVPQESRLVFYADFNGDVSDAYDHATLVSDVTLTTDRFGNLSSAAEFNGTTNYAAFEYASDLISESQTISYWLQLPASADYDTHVRTSGYVTFALGGFEGFLHEWGRFDCCDNTFDFLKYVTSHENAGTASTFASEFLEMKGENRQGDNIDEIDNLAWLEELTGQWILVTTSYDAANRTKTIYINGDQVIEISLVASDDGNFDLRDIMLNADEIAANENNNNTLYLGAGLPFWGNITTGNSIEPKRGDLNHAYKGLMDDFRIFNVALTDAEVEELYNAERP